MADDFKRITPSTSRSDDTEFRQISDAGDFRILGPNQSSINGDAISPFATGGMEWLDQHVIEGGETRRNARPKDLEEAVKQVGARTLESIATNPLVRMGWKLGSNVLTTLQRGQDAFVAGQRILIHSLKGESTANLITPLEVLAGWDLRGQSLPDVQQSVKEGGRPGKPLIERGGEGIPGQRELLQDIIGEDKVQVLKDSPFLLFGIPATKDNLTALTLGKKLTATVPEGYSDYVLTNEDIVRLGMNMVNDVYLPLNFISMGSKGVRNVRHYLVSEEAEGIGEHIVTKLDDTLKNVGLSPAAQRLPNPLLSNEGVVESPARVYTQMLEEAARGLRDPNEIYTSTTEVLNRLDATNPDDVKTFLRVMGSFESRFKNLDEFATFDELTELAAGEVAPKVESVIEPTFREVLDATITNDSVYDLAKTADAFVIRAKTAMGDAWEDLLDELELDFDVNVLSDPDNPFLFNRLKRLTVGDLTNAGGLTERPTLLTLDGRVVLERLGRTDVRPSRGAPAILPGTSLDGVLEELPVTPTSRSTVTGDAFEMLGTVPSGGYRTPWDGVVIDTWTTKNPTTDKTELVYKFNLHRANFPEDMDAQTIREVQAARVDRVQEFITNATTLAQAERAEAAIQLKNARRVAADIAEEEFYRKFGVEAPHAIRGAAPVAQRKQVIAEGRRLLRNLSDDKRNRVKLAIQKLREKAALKAEKESIGKFEASSVNRRFILAMQDLTRPSSDLDIKYLEITPGDITVMMSRDKDLRDIINAKAPIKGVARVTDSDGTVMGFLSPRGASRPRVIPRDPDRLFKTYDELIKEANSLKDDETTLLSFVRKNIHPYFGVTRFGSKMMSVMSDPDLYAKAVSASLSEATEAQDFRAATAFKQYSKMVDDILDTTDEYVNQKLSSPKSHSNIVIDGADSPPSIDFDDGAHVASEGSANWGVRDISLGWFRDPEQVLGGDVGIFPIFAAAEYGMQRTRAVISEVLAQHMPNIKKGSPAADRIGRVMVGIATDAAGKPIELSPEERRGMVLLRTLMDTLMEKAGHAPSKDIRGYFSTLLKGVNRNRPVIAPDLLDTGASIGNQFYAHILGKKRGRVSRESYDVVEAFRLFERAVTREIHMAPAIEKAKLRAKEINLEGARARYLNMLIDRIQGKPTKLGRMVEEGITNALEKTKLGPVLNKLGISYDDPATRFSAGLTRAFYRGLLGGSAGFFFKNLSQVINTAADVGPLATLQGIAKMTTKSGRDIAKQQRLLSEFNRMFEEVGIFEPIAGESAKTLTRKIGAAKRIASRTLDTILFSPVHGSEFLNRGISFHAGVVAEARRLGVNLDDLFGPNADPAVVEEFGAQVLAAGHTVAQRTQFIYGVLGRSPIFTTPFGRMAGQFMTFPIKQAEFLADLAKHDKTGMMRYLALTGYWSHKMAQAGIDPTGFIGFGFIPQGVEPGVPLVLPPAFSAAYHLMRLSNAFAEGDLDRTERELRTVKRDISHLIPGGLQASRIVDFNKRYETYRIEDDRTKSLVRRINTKDQVLGLLGLPTITTRITRELAADMRRKQEIENFQRSIIVNEMLDYVNAYEDAKKKGYGVSDSLGEDRYWQKLIAQAIAWGLPITSEQLDEAANRRSISSYLRAALRNKRLTVEEWNRYIMAIPEEARDLGLQIIKER